MANAHEPDPGGSIANHEIADALERAGELLALQGADRFRVAAYQKAARLARTKAEPLAELLAREGREGLERLPGIGPRMASHIDEFVHSGRLAMLDRLEGQVSPEDLFTTVPGIGEELARRIHEGLHIETLEELEIAAHDGRLAELHGFGERRARGVADSLAGRLGRSVRRRARARRWHEHDGPTPSKLELAESPDSQPGVAAILSADREYRAAAERGELRRIAPRRFNPGKKAWLPVLHTSRDDWSFTLLFSNTARAHDLGRTRDWVVVYYERDGHEDQCTVVTEHAGDLAGKRVVRGREAECASYYAKARSGRSS